MIVCTNNVISIVIVALILIITLIFGNYIMNWVYLRVEYIADCLAGIIRDP